jgi:glycoprotein endo-alpha-1,2-mannosidase
MLVILACTSTGQNQIQTQAAVIGKTALAQGGEIARTQAARLEATAISIAETQADKLKETAVSAAATKVDDLQETVAAALETQLAGGSYPRQFPNTAQNDSILVGTYYYPWYGPGRNHWQDGYAQHPSLGEYDSADKKIINQHIDWAAGHGVDFFAVSWWGIGSREDQVFKDDLLNSPMKDEIKFAILYESTGLLPVTNDGTINLDSPDTLQKLLDDFKYFQDTYFDDPHYLKIGDRPVVFIYLTRIFTGDVGGAFSALRGALRSRGSEVYLIGDEVYWGNAQSLLPSHIQAFDAATAYNMHTSTPDIADNFTQKVLNEFSTWKVTADSLGVAFVPDALPGFDDSNVRPEANHPPIPRSVGLFESQLDMALSLLDPQINMFMITSWNEWHEDTSIEPAQEYDLEYLDALQRMLDSR